MEISKKINFIKESLFDFLFPRTCIGCGEEGLWCCESCFKKIELRQANHCPFCPTQTEDGRVCQNCLPAHAIFRLINLGFYKNSLWQSLIQNFKYQCVEETVQILERLTKQFFAKYPQFKQRRYDLVIPVPLHRRRFLERSFNQAEAFARILCSEIGTEINTSVLSRTKNTPPQAQLNDEQREKNIVGAFSAVDPTRVRGKKILLVDDVFTTGSTIREAAKTLLNAQASRVEACVMARRS
ncbi:ComF family protein [Patescibacteria group bacterium]|nr:ComF family protein [Patescibacteria group bacterium]MBU1922086.1 ComF family protein [Patescibacteria group bacterium]